MFETTFRNLDDTLRKDAGCTHCATVELLRNSTSKQMGNSAEMIEKHYSKLAATLAA